MMECPQCAAKNGAIMGYQLTGVYDGVLYWGCQSCGALWPRDFGDWDRLNEASRKAVIDHAASLVERGL